MGHRENVGQSSLVHYELTILKCLKECILYRLIWEEIITAFCYIRSKPFCFTEGQATCNVKSVISPFML